MSATRAEVCVVACAELFRGAGEILASPMGVVPALGARLARRTFSPDLLLSDGVATLVDDDGNAEGWLPYSRVFDTLWGGRRHVVMGASQIDRFGNQNIACIGPHERPRTMLIGARGAPGNTACHATSYWVGRHDTRLFVPAVDFVSGVGTNQGGRFHDLRGVVTNLGVFDFRGPDGAMRAVSLHPGVTWGEVVESTGFPVHRGADLPVTREPTPAELTLIRDVLDPRSTRDREVA